jgi:polygalacturonase
MLTATNGSIDALDASSSISQPDKGRIQQAIDACPTGQAVKLVMGSSGENGFLSGPLTLKSGVQLWIDAGVTLFASRNPSDFDNGPGTCGTATSADPHACTALIVATNTVGSGIVGAGTIDGRGGSLLTSGPNARLRTWWDVAYQSKTSGLNQQNPRLIQVNHGSNFTLHGITVQNSPNFHIVTSGVTGVTAWGIKILSPSIAYTKKGYACASNTTPDAVTPATCFTPDTVKNTDGFDPGQSSKVLLAWSYISTGDDDVAVKAGGSPTSSQLTFAHNHFYYGHGLSVGSETDAGVSAMAVLDLSIDGHDSPNGNGLRIKSDSSRGGKVQDVSYSQVCMRNVRRPLVFDPFYSSSTGKLYPSFTGIKLSGFHNLGSAKYGGGLVTFAGYDRNGNDNPLVITLDNVVFDGAQPSFEGGHNGGPSALPANTHFTFGPGAVSFASEISASAAKDVSVSGTAGSSIAVDCTNAFVPLSSVLASSPI